MKDRDGGQALAVGDSGLSSRIPHSLSTSKQNFEHHHYQVDYSQLFGFYHVPAVWEIILETALSGGDSKGSGSHCRYGDSERCHWICLATSLRQNQWLHFPSYLLPAFLPDLACDSVVTEEGLSVFLTCKVIRFDSSLQWIPGVVLCYFCFVCYFYQLSLPFTPPGCG